MTSPKGNAESTCPQNRPKLAQTPLPVHAGYRTGTCHYPDREPGDCRPRRSTPPAHVTFTPTTRGAPGPPPARPGAPNPALLPGGDNLASYQQKPPQTHVPRAPPTTTTKRTKAASGIEAANDCAQGDPSHKTNPELLTRFPAGTCSSPSGVVRAWSRGVAETLETPKFPSLGAQKPDALGLSDHSTRGAQAPGALPRTRSREGGPWQRKRQDLSPGSRAASEAVALAPFSFQPHRATEAPEGAEPAEIRPMRAPYCPKGARRKPRLIRAFTRAPSHHHVSQWGEGAGPAASAKGRPGSAARAPLQDGRGDGAPALQPGVGRQCCWGGVRPSPPRLVWRATLGTSAVVLFLSVMCLQLPAVVETAGTRHM